MNVRPLSRVVLAVTLALALTGAARATPTRPTGTLHVLAVAVSDSADQKNVVLGGKRNAEAVVRLFAAQQGRLYETVSQRTLLGRDATADAVRAALDDLACVVMPGDSVVVYVNAHGGIMDDGEWAFAATDFRQGLFGPSGLVTASDLRACLEGLAAPVVLMLDSCHSGAFGDGAAGLTVLACCQADGYGINSLRLRRSLFSVALEEALSGKADRDGDGVVTLAELDGYLAVRLREMSRTEEIEALREWYRRETGLTVPDQMPSLRRPGDVAPETAVVLPRRPTR
jgi:hypothetical protein